MTKREVMEPTQAVSEACLQWPSGILQATGDSNKTMECWGRVEGTVIEYATIMRETSAFHPRNLGGFSVVYTNRPEGKSLTSLVFELFGSLPWEGVSAKVAIGCSPLIEGLLQIQLPRIHNQEI